MLARWKELPYYSPHLDGADLAQSVEQLTCNQ